MAGLVIFQRNYRRNEGASQIPAIKISSEMTYDQTNLKEVLVAAGQTDARIGGVIDHLSEIFDVDAIDSKCIEKVGNKLLQLPAELPKNQEYWAASAEMDNAKKACDSNYLEVKESVHVSFSCRDPHMTVIVYNKGQQVGTNIHVCVESDGTKWKFTNIHQ